jgi:hypothetical protein
MKSGVKKIKIKKKIRAKAKKKVRHKNNVDTL